MSVATNSKASTSTLPEQEPVLRVYNSLTRSKDVFKPRKPRHIDWYNCGPTVYDSSHMGHARNYLTQDIIRRILRDYFGYNVNFVMNITDIDDKIILRAREKYLLDETKSKNTSITPTLLNDTKLAFSKFLSGKLIKSLPSIPSGLSDSQDDLQNFLIIIEKDKSDPIFAEAARQKEEKYTLYLASLLRAHGAIKKAEALLNGSSQQDVVDLVDGTSDVLGPYYGETLGHTISDPIAVSRQLALYWEDQFFQDMSKLNILPPNTKPRVSEYVKEIVEFVEQIINNGFAYEAEGSVWFDVNKFDGAEGDGFRHDYAKLQPGSKGNKKLLDEGEGALTGSKGKKQSADFALWKAKSKPGEPAWPSPWGEGRPGWHIECSVMASAILGKGMDIHSGGVDLMFPHHDNELAQSEAYHGCEQWVNYFLHTGHLHIEGLKMSKSLKNFITIDEELSRNTARRLRLAFMLQTWNQKLDYSRGLIADTKAKEETFDNFFANVNARLSQAGPSADGLHQNGPAEEALTIDLFETQKDFHAALCDSFNTPNAIQSLLDLIAKTNIYISSKGRDANLNVVTNIAEWITRMLRMFGLGEGTPTKNGIGWGTAVVGGEEVNGQDISSQIEPWAKSISSFRDAVRKLAMDKSLPPTELSKQILALSDRFRDEEAIALGLQLDDGQGSDGGALFKIVDPQSLIAAREEKRKIAADKLAKKEANARAAEEKRIAQLEKGKISPKDMFKPPNTPQGIYTEWDDQGLPTKDAEGKEVSKSLLKKLAKEVKVQEKLHEAYLAWVKEQEGK
ncbi:cysteine-tRNA ligase [Kwoniella pini CBS 10737]|uniref:cysteine--tRNA ligase n=1 Tax=Kwoniella pini CBS 10737 TaxID=1296096 RepID=A0A1B9I968_9TREE|nr:cysteine-tRNA ligase [Kwoniella pini CBS 10737]OCF52138.1 cysteine-tRNA ligase [Kwoniella pini CBS 10737]